MKPHEIVLIVASVIVIASVAIYVQVIVIPLASQIAKLSEELPLSEPQYVLCSDYHIITDRYKTPAGFYIVVNNETVSINETQYNGTRIGESVKLIEGKEYIGYLWMHAVVMDGDRSYALRPVTEAESGYREACKVGYP